MIEKAAAWSDALPPSTRRTGLSTCSIFFATLSLAAQGCASLHHPGCNEGEKWAVTDTLYFGAAKPGGLVTEEQWNLFIDEAATPAFPEGLTTWSAEGRWRMANGAIEHEPSHVLQLTHDGTDARDRAVRTIMERYKKDFQQEAVLRVRSRTCISF
jgi:hypothetical protein